MLDDINDEPPFRQNTSSSTTRAGLLSPCALVAKARLPIELRGAVAPYVCVILDRYRAIEWNIKRDATASLARDSGS